MFIEEREGKNIIESERGFATYSFTEDAVYMEDIYIHPEHRRSGETFKMAEEIGKIAKSKGKKKMLGSVVPTAKGSSLSLKLLLDHGFKLDSSTNNFILVSRDL